MFKQVKKVLDANISSKVKVTRAVYGQGKAGEGL